MTDVHAPDAWGFRFWLHRSGGSAFYLPDHQGTNRQLLDAGQAVTDTLLTDAWGVEVTRTGSTPNPFAAFGQWGYYRDTASRLYVRARHLAPSRGVFASSAPTWAIAGLEHRYGYAGNAPVTSVDPQGTRPLLTVRVSAFIHERISAQWRKPRPWFPEMSNSSSRYLTNSNNRVAYSHVDDGEHKVYASASIDCCDIGVAGPSEYWARTGWTRRLDTTTGREDPPRHADFMERVLTPWVAGHASGIRMSLKAAYPYYWPAQLYPVLLRMDLTIRKGDCDITGRRLVTLDARLVTTQFPDFDLLYRVGDLVSGQWYEWSRRPTTYTHPAQGLDRPLAVWGAAKVLLLSPCGCG